MTRFSFTLQSSRKQILVSSPFVVQVTGVVCTQLLIHSCPSASTERFSFSSQSSREQILVSSPSVVQVGIVARTYAHACPVLGITLPVWVKPQRRVQATSPKPSSVQVAVFITLAVACKMCALGFIAIASVFFVRHNLHSLTPEPAVVQVGVVVTSNTPQSQS